MDYGKISVIIPVYNISTYLKKCITSVLEQTYKNLEILLINDGSTDDSEDVIDFYVQKDCRVKKIVHENNKGLFHARLTGLEYCTGDYVTFLDSDDYISIDYCRTLVKKSFEEKADIVEASFVHEVDVEGEAEGTGRKFTNQYNSICFEKLDGDDVKDKFFEQSGLFFHCHTGCNKLYSRNLIDKTLDILKKQKKHLIMTEDIVFGSVFFLNAQSYCSIKNNHYFYLMRANASTGNSREYSKTVKNIEDMKTSFTFVRDYLIESGNTKYIDNLKDWRDRYYRIWLDVVNNAGFEPSQEAELRNKLQDAFDRHYNIDEPLEVEDLLATKVTATWSDHYEKLKCEICSQEIEYVSFDIFDTLLYKPFFEPIDLFNLIEEYFHEISPKSKYLRFSDIRQKSEQAAREKLELNNKGYEEVDLDEIYDEMKNTYHFTDEIVTLLKEKEIELELKFIYKRNLIFEIYEMALSLGKKILFISDTYLSKDTVEKMVEYLGYTEYYKIYVSSDTRLLKSTGNLFNFVKKDLNITGAEVIHIGDDMKSDYIIANEAGFKGRYFAKATDAFLNKLENRYTGNSVIDIYLSNPTDFRDKKYHLKYSGVRTLLGVVANKLFDNPYIPYNRNTEFNSDPYFIGYYALGMHLFQLCNWMKNQMDKRKVNKIHFVAKDGYVVRKAFNIMFPEVETNYVDCSIQSLLPITFLERENIFYIEEVINFEEQSLETLKNMLFLICKDDIDIHAIEQKGIIYNEKFKTRTECRLAIEILYDDIIDKEKLVNHCDKIKAYLKNNISEDGICFDVGYTGKTQVMICDALGFSVDTLYVHGIDEESVYNQRVGDFNIDFFYDFVPVTSAVVRETLLSGNKGICIGFEEKDGEIIPIIEKHDANYFSEFMISTIQQAGLDFVRDYNESYKDYYKQLTYINTDCSMPLEYYIHSKNKIDKYMFLCTYFADNLQNQNEYILLLDWWENENSRIVSDEKDENK